MITHEILVDEIGGADVLTCGTLGFKMIELVGNVTQADVKRTILSHLHIQPEDARADFGVEITDNRPPSEKWSDKQKREDREHKPRRTL